MTLPPVKFKKLKRDEAEALVNILGAYSNANKKELTHQLSVRFHSAAQHTALVIELFLLLRKKYESGKPHFSLSIKVQHAVTLLFACSDYFVPGVSTFENAVAMATQNEIDQQLKSINFKVT